MSLDEGQKSGSAPGWAGQGLRGQGAFCGPGILSAQVCTGPGALPACLHSQKPTAALEAAKWDGRNFPQQDNGDDHTCSSVLPSACTQQQIHCVKPSSDLCFITQKHGLHPPPPGTGGEEFILRGHFLTI